LIDRWGSSLFWRVTSVFFILVLDWNCHDWIGIFWPSPWQIRSFPDLIRDGGLKGRREISFLDLEFFLVVGKGWLRWGGCASTLD
jgi:hypothetical protein